jgi:hypothetical protein
MKLRAKMVTVCQLLCRVVIFFSTVFLFFSCVSGGVPRASGAGEICFTSRENQYGAVITVAAHPVSEKVCEVRSIYFFSNWREGWSEVRFSADGQLSVEQSGSDTWTLKITGPVTIDRVEQASLRYQDTILENDQARVQMQNRWDRITAVCSWLSPQGRGCTDMDYVLFSTDVQYPQEFDEIIKTGTLQRDWMEAAALFKLALTLPLNDTNFGELVFKKEK